MTFRRRGSAGLLGGAIWMGVRAVFATLAVRQLFLIWCVDF